MRDLVYDNKSTSLRSQVKTIPPFAWQELGVYSNGDNQDDSPRKNFFFIPDASLAFIDLNGEYTVLSKSRDGANPPKLEAHIYFDEQRSNHRKTNKIVANDSKENEQLVVLEPISFGKGQQPIGLVQISTPTGPLKELLMRQLLVFFILSLLALIIGLFGYLPILRRTLVPLSNMVETTEQIDAGNLDRRFPTKQGQMEIDRLADSFNGMLERLEASFEAEKETQAIMRRFVADASHELRTPLTSIHGFLEVLLRGAANNPEQLNKALQSMYSESNRLHKLIKDLLLLTKLDQSPSVILVEGYLDELISEMEPQIQILAGERKFILELEPHLVCRFDADKVKQVILNLVHNAVQYTDSKNGVIHIKLISYYKGVQLSIADNGAGISKIHLPHIFDRFYRSDSSRTRKIGGAGLGLSISKSIVDAHGGTIRVVSEEGKGTAFHIWFPCC
jgi:two-component system OmpR family sensor kinase